MKTDTQSINQSINQSIPLFKWQTSIAVEEPLNGDTINQNKHVLQLLK